MKKLLLIGLFAVFSAVASPDTYFPVSLAPESLQSLRGGFNKGKWTAGLELSMHGEKERGWIENLMGDWSHFNHSFSVGYITENFENSITYGSVYAYLSAWESVGTGVKHIIYYNTGLASGQKLRGELTYFLFYQFNNKSVFLGRESEYLSFYLGFKSDHFDFQSEGIEDYIDKAINLPKMSKNIVLGVYYNPNVSGIWSVGAEINGKESYLVTLFFNL